MTNVLIILLGIIAMVFFTLVYYQRNKQQELEFQIKLEAAKTARNNHILNMSYKDLLTVVDANILHYVDQAIIISGIAEKKSDEEKSLLFNSILTDICSMVEMSLADSLKEGILFYISEEHMRTYIKDSSRVLLIAKIEQRALKK